MDKKPRLKLKLEEEVAEDARKAPLTWKLTEADKTFLRSCNICPD